jgi:hypothetical protein
MLLCEVQAVAGEHRRFAVSVARSLCGCPSLRRSRRSGAGWTARSRESLGAGELLPVPRHRSDGGQPVCGCAALPDHSPALSCRATRRGACRGDRNGSSGHARVPAQPGTDRRSRGIPQDTGTLTPPAAWREAVAKAAALMPPGADQALPSGLFQHLQFRRGGAAPTDADALRHVGGGLAYRSPASCCWSACR